jgi:hypothetical protein
MESLLDMIVVGTKVGEMVCSSVEMLEMHWECVRVEKMESVQVER